MASANRARSILLVEDNDNDVALARAAFARCGVPHELRVAVDGVAATEQLFAASRAGGAPDLVLLDLKLPGIDGFEVLRRIRATPHLRGAAVVVFSSSVEERDVTRSLHDGANSYVRKPIDFDDFVDAAKLLARYWLELNVPPPPDAAITPTTANSTAGGRAP